ncbi:MAG: DUF4214 domain-containing protein, partial [Candidatus Competibacterales bacterium]
MPLTLWMGHPRRWWLLLCAVFALTAFHQPLFANYDTLFQQILPGLLGRDPTPLETERFQQAIAAGRPFDQAIDDLFRQPEYQSQIEPVARLYFAAFERAPDVPGLTFWANVFRQIPNLVALADEFATAPEFDQRYSPNLDDPGFIRQLYLNVLNREPDEPGQAFWLDVFQQGLSRGFMLAQFSESTENIDRAAPRARGGGLVGAVGAREARRGAGRGARGRRAAGGGGRP